MLSSYLGQANLSVGQVSFHFHLPIWKKGPSKSSDNNITERQTKTCQGQAKFENQLRQGQLEFLFSTVGRGEWGQTKNPSMGTAQVG